jgi:hypothetical protein
MAIHYETTTLRAEAIFALSDTFAHDRSALAPFVPPLGEVGFQVLGPTGGQRFAEPLELIVTRNESGFYLYFGLVRLPDSEFRRRSAADTGRRRNRLLAGSYTVRIESGFYQPVEVDLALPARDQATPFDISLQPAPAYPFRNISSIDGWIGGAACQPDIQRPGAGPTLLRGSLHKVDGTPIEGASVSASNLITQLAGPVVSSQTGDWVLALPIRQATEPVTVTVARDGFPDIHVSGLCVVRGKEAIVRETSLRGWVLQRGAGVRGATVAIDGRPATVSTGADGGWFYYVGLDDPLASSGVPISVRATLPTGESQINIATLAPHATALVPSFRFT